MPEVENKKLMLGHNAKTKISIQKTCPLCKKGLSNISTHLKVHGLTSEEIKDICFTLRIRKKVLSCRKTRSCPFPECKFIEPYSRLDKHLRNKHKLKPNDEQYKALIAPPKTGKKRDLRPCIENKACLKKTCPLCKEEVVGIRMHLRNHGLSIEKVNEISSSLRTRKKNLSSRNLRSCSFPECKFSKPYSRLDKHLRSKHKLKPSDEQYKALLMSAKVCETEQNLSLGTKNKTRLKKTCPICNKGFSNFSAHLKVHGLTVKEIHDICFSLRGRKKSLSSRNVRICPFPECKFKEPYPRLDKHFRYKHKLKPGDQQYKAFIAIAKASGEKDKSEAYSDFSKRQCQEFSHYLQSVNDNLDKKFVDRQGHKLCEIIHGMQLQSLEHITDDENMTALQEWATSRVQNYGFANAKSYLFVFLRFLRYVYHEKKANISQDSILRCKRKFKKWKETLCTIPTKGVKEEGEILLIEVAFFENSQIHKDAIAILKADRENFTIEEHALARNFLLLKGLFTNLATISVLLGLTIEEFLKAKTEEDEGKVLYVIGVKKHDMDKDCGPTNLILSQDLYALYHLYYKNFRMKLPSISTSRFIF